MDLVASLNGEYSRNKSESARQKVESSDGEENTDGEETIGYSREVKEEFGMKNRKRRGAAGMEEEEEGDDDNDSRSPGTDSPHRRAPLPSPEEGREFGNDTSPPPLSPPNPYSSGTNSNINDFGQHRPRSQADPVLPSAPLVGILGKNIRTQRSRKSKAPCEINMFSPEDDKDVDQTDHVDNSPKAMLDVDEGDSRLSGSNEEDGGEDMRIPSHMSSAPHRLQVKDKYLRPLGSENWQKIGRGNNRSLKGSGSKGRDRDARASVSPGSQPVYQPGRHSSNSILGYSSAAETLMLVFPGKRRAEIDIALQKTGGDVLKAIQLLVAPDNESAASINYAPNHHNNNNSSSQSNHHNMHHPFHGSRAGQQSFSPSSQAIDLAMEYPKMTDKNSYQLNNNLKNARAHGAATNLADVGGNGSGNVRPLTPGSMPHENPSAFSLFNTYSAAAAARFNANQPLHRRYIPSLLPYSLHGLHQSVDFYTNRPLPLMSALNVGQHGQMAGTPAGNGSLPGVLSGSLHLSPNAPGIQTENGNTMERECGTPPTSCSGSDRASYSE